VLLEADCPVLAVKSQKEPAVTDPTVSGSDSGPAFSVASGAHSLSTVLERNRRTLAWKTAGLDQEGMRATTAASAMTVGGLVKHLALVEANWPVVKLGGQEIGPPWAEVDFDADFDWEWRTGALDAPEEVRALGRYAVARSRVVVTAVIHVDVVEGRVAASRWRHRQASSS
jgi:hypothetical protein